MKRILIMAAAALAFCSCGLRTGRNAADVQSDSTATAMEQKKIEEPMFDIVTSKGTMRIKLYDKTPKHRENFKKLVKEKYYDGIRFHRVIEGFMIQAGDPYSRDTAKIDLWGQGGPDYTVPAEFVNEYWHKKGAIAAARRGDMANPTKASSGSQFYIVQDENACLHLDGQYTIFGEVVEGLDIIDIIAGVETDLYDRPSEDIFIKAIRPVITEPVMPADSLPAAPGDSTAAVKTELSMDMKGKFKYIFFDADDTLWENESFFRAAEDQFAALLSDYTSPEGVQQMLWQKQEENIPLFGYGSKTYMIGMTDAAMELCGGKLPEKIYYGVKKIITDLAFHEFQLIEGVKETLEALQGRYTMIVATKGDLTEQLYKYRRSGLCGYFHHCEVMENKDEKNYLELAAKHNIDPSELLMIGNSVKSDIAPVVNIGGWAINTPHDVVWVHEMMDMPESDRILIVRNIREIVQYLA